MKRNCYKSLNMALKHCSRSMFWDLLIFPPLIKRNFKDNYDQYLGISKLAHLFSFSIMVI